MVKLEEVTVYLHRGDSKKYGVTIVNENDNKLDLTGDSAKLTIKKYEHLHDFVIQKNGTILNQGTNKGEVEFELVPDDTKNLKCNDNDFPNYVFDVQITGGAGGDIEAGKVYTVVKGKWILLYDVTT